MKEKEFKEMVKFFANTLTYKAPDFSQYGPMFYWFKKFGHHSQDKLYKAFDSAAVKLGYFPSPKDFSELLGNFELTDVEKARELSASIIKAISKFGYNNSKKAKGNLDPIAWRIIQNEGGWRVICEVLMEEKAIKLAQWRELAMVEMKKEKIVVPEFLGIESGGETKLSEVDVEGERKVLAAELEVIRKERAINGN